jgi:tetratricopeptide (TPR) repeat protein
MQMLVFISLLALSIFMTYPVQAEDLTACIVAKKVRDRGEFDRALSLYSTCIAEGALSDSTKSVALNNRGNVYLDTDQYNYAIADFNASIVLNPAYPNPYNNRGMANQFKGLYNSAVADFSKALEIDSRHLNAASNLAWIRATCPVRSLRDGKHALELAIRVNGATNYQDPINLETLAAAYAESGKFDLAIAYQRKAMSLDGQAELKQHRDRLSYYQQGRAYRDLSNL